MTRRVHGNKPWGGQFWTPITPDRGSIFHADQQVEEARLRRAANRRGLILRKCRRRDHNAIDYGLYALIDPDSGGTIHPMGVISPFSLTLDDVRQWLASRRGVDVTFIDPKTGKPAGETRRVRPGE